LNLIYLWLFPFDRGIHQRKWQIANSSYLRIASLVTIFEVLIGHAPDCTRNDKCSECGKQLPHRAISESKWRQAFLTALPITHEVNEQYSSIIDVAYNEVRHPTVHKAGFPTASYIPQVTDHEVYDMDRTTREFKSDSTALLSLLISVNDVTRYLLLHKVFGLQVFPPLLPLQSTRFVSGSAAE
jgi:hypothetical protein